MAGDAGGRKLGCSRCFELHEMRQGLIFQFQRREGHCALLKHTTALRAGIRRFMSSATPAELMEMNWRD